MSTGSIRLLAPFIKSPGSIFRGVCYADIARLRIRIPFYEEYILAYVSLLLDVKKRVRCQVLYVMALLSVTIFGWFGFVMAVDTFEALWVGDLENAIWPGLGFFAVVGCFVMSMRN